MKFDCAALNDQSLNDIPTQALNMQIRELQDKSNLFAAAVIVLGTRSLYWNALLCLIQDNHINGRIKSIAEEVKKLLEQGQEHERFKMGENKVLEALIQKADLQTQKELNAVLGWK